VNGADVGSLLYSRLSCHDIVTHISAQMKHVLVEYIVQSGSKFSVMVDESTTVSAKCTLIVYIRLEYDGEVTNYFWDLVELKDKTGEELL